MLGVVGEKWYIREVMYFSKTCALAFRSGMTFNAFFTSKLFTMKMILNSENFSSSSMERLGFTPFIIFSNSILILSLLTFSFIH